MVVVARFVWLGVIRLGEVVFRCPIGGSRGRRPWYRQAGGGCRPRRWGCVSSGLRGCSSRFPPFRLDGGCAFVVCGGPFSRFLFLGRWGFPPFPVVLVFFWGGGVSPVPPSALTDHALGGERRGELACRLFCGFPRAVPLLRAHCGLCTLVSWWPVLLGPGSGSAGWAVVPAGFVGS